MFPALFSMDWFPVCNLFSSSLTSAIFLLFVVVEVFCACVFFSIFLALMYCIFLNYFLSVYSFCWSSLICIYVYIYVFYLGFLLQPSTNHRTAGEGGGHSLTPHYHFHPLPRHLDISRAITAGSSPLHIGSSQTWTGNLWFLRTSH